MEVYFKLYSNLCLLACLLLAINGCDWDVPLTSPHHAKIDAKLIGNWLVEKSYIDEDANRSLILSIGATNKISASNEGKEDGVPSGAMIISGINYRSPGYPGTESFIMWPTKMGNMNLLNISGVKIIREKTDEGYFMFKYEIFNDNMKLYSLSNIKEIKSHLGATYSSADLLQEIIKASWEPMLTAKRIQ